jgi:hypothetical protein
MPKGQFAAVPTVKDPAMAVVSMAGSGGRAASWRMGG